MDFMKAKLNMSKEELESFLNDPDWDTTSVKGLGKLLSEIIHVCILNAIIKITENGYSEEVAKHVILRCGPFHGAQGNLESNIVERALTSLRTNKKHDDAAYYTFHEITKLVDFMTLEMVTALREMKPSLSVRDAVWSLMMCDLDVHRASVAEIDLQSISAFETVSQSESKNQKPPLKKSSDGQSSKSGKKADEAFKYKNLWSIATHKRDLALRHKASLLLEKPYTGRVKGLKKKFSTLKDLSVVDKLYGSSSSSSSSSDEQNKNVSLPLKEIEEKPKVTPKPEAPAKLTADYYLKDIPCDEKGEYMPRDDKDKLILESVARLQSLQNELQSWDDWGTSKVMEVTKELSKHQQEVKMLKAEREEAKKFMEGSGSLEENTAKRLLDTTRTLNTTNTELNEATSTIVKLQSEQTVIAEQMERERVRSLLEAKKLKQALIKEEQALKKSVSFQSEKAALEEELKVLRRQVGVKQREVEKARRLLTETEIRVAKEERESAKAVNEAESMKKERERVEALAMAEYEITKGKAEEELKKYETEKKRIEYEISAVKLEAESKRIAAMHKSMRMNKDSSKRLDVFRNISEEKKKKKMERECVMCLDEEMTVVFVPCGHQVLCEACNVKHKESMNECPACRTLIQQRISVRFA